MKGERSASLNFNFRLVVTLDRLRRKVLQNESRTKGRLNAVQIWFQRIRLGITLHPFPMEKECVHVPWGDEPSFTVSLQSHSLHMVDTNETVHRSLALLYT